MPQDTPSPEGPANKSETCVSSACMGDLFLTMVLLDEAALLRDLADAGVDVNVRGPSGQTLLMLAVGYAAQCRGKQKTKMVAVISSLLQNGANVNLADETGETALSLALKLRQKSIAELLASHGADFPSRIN